VLQEDGRTAKEAHTGWSAGEDEVARIECHEAGGECDDGCGVVDLAVRIPERGSGEQR
jgi:hypothetical protein